MRSIDDWRRQAVTPMGQILPSIDQAIGNRRVGVDSAVAQERPVAANFLESFQVDFADQDFFAVVRGFGEDAAEGIAEK